MVETINSHLNEKWKQQANNLRSQAALLPHGQERESLIKQARQLESAIQMESWLSSKELQGPR